MALVLEIHMPPTPAIDGIPLISFKLARQPVLLYIGALLDSLYDYA